MRLLWQVLIFGSFGFRIGLLDSLENIFEVVVVVLILNRELSPVSCDVAAVLRQRGTVRCHAFPMPDRTRSTAVGWCGSGAASAPPRSQQPPGSCIRHNPASSLASCASATICPKIRSFPAFVAENLAGMRSSVSLLSTPILLLRPPLAQREASIRMSVVTPQPRTFFNMLLIAL
jgi:hypothetical protein